MGRQGFYTSSFMAMGTRCDLVIFHADNGFAERVFQVIKKETLQLEFLLSRFQDGSPVSKFNSLKKGEPFIAGDFLWDVLLKCRNYRNLTFGAFDVTSLPVIRLWKDQPSDYMPCADEIESALRLTGFDKILFHEEKKTLEKLIDGVEIDFGAIGKGIALDYINELLKQQKIENAFISFGESSVLALGKHPNGDYWPVGIPHPYKPEELLHVFNVVDGCVTTSATVVKKGNLAAQPKRHIVDPRTGRAIIAEAIVSVKSESAAMGEVISTSWLILNEEEREKLEKEVRSIEIFWAEIAINEPENSLSTDL